MRHLNTVGAVAMTHQLADVTVATLALVDDRRYRDVLVDTIPTPDGFFDGPISVRDMMKFKVAVMKRLIEIMEAELEVTRADPVRR